MSRATTVAVAGLVTVVAVFLVGSVLIDAAMPAGFRSAMVLTAPGHTGSLVRDWAVTTFQIIVLALGAVAAIVSGCRIGRRQGRE